MNRCRCVFSYDFTHQTCESSIAKPVTDAWMERQAYPRLKPRVRNSLRSCPQNFSINSEFLWRSLPMIHLMSLRSSHHVNQEQSLRVTQSNSVYSKMTCFRPPWWCLSQFPWIISTTRHLYVEVGMILRVLAIPKFFTYLHYFGSSAIIWAPSPWIFCYPINGADHPEMPMQI